MPEGYSSRPNRMKPSKYRRWFVRLAWSFAWLVTLVCLVLAFEGWRGFRAWTGYEAELIAKGDSPAPSAVIPPRIPDADNFAATPVVRNWFDEAFQASVYDLVPNRSMGASPPSRGNWQRGTRTTMEEYADYLENGHPSIGSAPERVLHALSRFEPVLNELRMAGERSGSRFPIDYEKGYEARLPHLVAMQKLSVVLSLRAEAQLQLSETEGALKDCLLALRLPESLADDPSIISLLVECSMDQAALNPVWQGIAEHRWSDSELTRLDASLAHVNLARRYLITIRGERNLGIFSLQSTLSERPWGFRVILGTSDSSKDSDLVWSLLATKGWIYQNQVAIGRLLDAAAATVDGESGRFFPERSLEVERSIRNIANHRRPTNFLAAVLMPAYIPVLSRAAGTQANVDLARVAIALERHRQIHSGYPETLEALDPGVIPTGGMPTEPASGESFRYYRDAEAYSLYSKGWDQDDDGGALAFKEGSTTSQDLLQGDWPWPSRPR